MRKKAIKVSWYDYSGNKHDLDFVLEKEGSPTVQGNPVAFIEAAWRKSTKHSKNKVQEIEGALGPLAQRYNHLHPFKGAVLAGDFTGPAISQLRSSGFSVLYFPKDTVMAAFSQFGIDARYEDDATVEEISALVAQWNAIEDKAAVATALIAQNTEEITTFVNELQIAVNRNIEVIHILPLHGRLSELTTVADAVHFMNSYAEVEDLHPFVQYEIIVRYNTRTKISGVFSNKVEAIEFLNRFV